MTASIKKALREEGAWTARVDPRESRNWVRNWARLGVTQRDVCDATRSVGREGRDVEEQKALR